MTRMLPLLMLSLLLPATGCTQLLGPSPDSQAQAQLSKRAYPADAKLGPDLDILVIPHGPEIQLVNRTPHTYTRMELWLNQQWVGLAPRITLGTDNTLDLNKFINRHGEAYPFGSLLQPDKAQPIVLAELYDPVQNLRHRLIVRQTGL